MNSWKVKKKFIVLATVGRQKSHCLRCDGISVLWRKLLEWVSICLVQLCTWWHCTLHTTHRTLHTTHRTQHIAHHTPHTAHCRLGEVRSLPIGQNSLQESELAVDKTRVWGIRGNLTLVNVTKGMTRGEEQRSEGKFHREMSLKCSCIRDPIYPSRNQIICFRENTATIRNCLLVTISW